MRRTGILLLALCCSLCFIVPAAVAEADENEVAGLTLQQAVELALQKDKSLKKAEAEVERTEKQRDDASKSVEFTPIIGHPYDPLIEANWYNLLSADLTWRMSKKTLEAERDTLALKTCKSYWDVQAAQDKLALQEKLEKQALLNLQNARTGQRVGTVAPYQLAEADAGWQQAKFNLEAAKQELDNAYSALNQLVGFKADERYTLVDKPAYEPLQIKNLDYEVARVIASSPSTWLAQQKVTLQEWAKDMMFATGQYTSYQVRRIELNQAELDAASAEDLMEQVTRNLYHNIKAMESSYLAAQEALQTAQESLRIAEVKYDAGMATRAEVAAAEVAVAKVEKTLNDLTRQHAYLKLAFEKPWAASLSTVEQPAM